MVDAKTSVREIIDYAAFFENFLESVFTPETFDAAIPSECRRCVSFRLPKTRMARLQKVNKRSK